jgi:hypothetical protein
VAVAQTASLIWHSVGVLVGACSSNGATPHFGHCAWSKVSVYYS